MVQSVVLLRIFNRHHIADVFNHTDNRIVSCRVGTNPAGFGIRNIMANPAMLYFVPKLNQTVSKSAHFRSFLSKKVQNQAKRTFPADSRKLGKFVYSVLK
jgi:hypothetical protein